MVLQTVVDPVLARDSASGADSLPSELHTVANCEQTIPSLVMTEFQFS